MLEVRGLTKEYPTPQGPVRVLEGVAAAFEPGVAASIMGPSGSGKSTLLYILGALEPPTRGVVTLGGVEPFQLEERELAAFRNRRIGFVFQDHLLLPQCSVLENVLTPTLVGEPDPTAEKRARELIDEVGLAGRLHHRPDALSGGERQRVALARALIRRPPVLLCDEPTGNLDEASADTVVSMLFELHERLQNILVVVTHNTGLAARCPAQYVLAGHRLEPRPTGR